MIRKRNISNIFAVLLVTVLIVSVISQQTIYSATLAGTLGMAMAVIAITDARYFIVPDVISLPMIVLGIILSPLFPHQTESALTLFYSAIAALVGFLVFYSLRRFYELFRKREGLGLGDVKLAAVAGAWTGLEGMNMVFLLSSLSAICFISLKSLSGNKVKSTTAIPFGVFIAPSIWIVWVTQSVILN